MARALQEPLAKALGQNVIVENKSGAAGSLGALIANVHLVRADGPGLAALLGGDGERAEDEQEDDEVGARACAR